MRLVTVLLAIVMVVGGCGSDDNPDSPPTGVETTDPAAVEKTCAGTTPVREAIAKRDMPGITSAADQVASDADRSGDSGLIALSNDVVREGQALVKADQTPEFYKEHLASMETALSSIDKSCD